MKSSCTEKVPDTILTATDERAASDAMSFVNHAPGAPYDLLTNEAEYPMNIEGAPLFDWWVNDEDCDEVQTAYQIRLSVLFFPIKVI